MPFGYDCEFTSFDACVAKQMEDGKTREEAEKICGALQRDTEEECAKKQIQDGLEFLRGVPFN